MRRIFNNAELVGFRMGCIQYASVEHGFRSLMTVDPRWQLMIRMAPTVEAARRLSELSPLRPDWEQVKTTIMHQLLLAKFSQSPDLWDELVATGDTELVPTRSEVFLAMGAPTHSTSVQSEGVKFWGKPANWLGKLLMVVRDELSDPLVDNLVLPGVDVDDEAFTLAA